jgi:hypothetical protein
MKAYNWRIIIGALLVVFGAVYLLQTFNIIMVRSLPWAILFGFGGLAFLYVVVKDRKQWWATIPGVILLSIGFTLGLDYADPSFAGSYGATVILGGIGLSFLVVYLLNFVNWWAIIPAGVMLTIAVMTVLEKVVSGGSGISGVVFFIGLAATFALLSILPNGGEKMNWPWIPAASLLFVGFIISIATATLLNYFWPILLIMLGIFVVYRAFRRGK